MKKLFLFIIIGLCILTNVCTAQYKHFAVSQIFHINSPGWWDYLAVNDNNLYISHGTQVNVLDKTTGDSVGIIANTEGVHGIAFVPALHKGYTTNGKTNNATVFDLATNKVLGQVATGQNPDAIMYDSHSKKIIVCNGKSNDLSIIDPVTDKLVSTIALGGKPEEAVTDNVGNLYVNIEDKTEIVVVDMKALTVKHHWPIAPGEGPTGLAIDTKTNRLFAGCDKLLVVLNATNGKLVTKLPIGDGCDGVAWDETLHNIYTSNGEGTMTIIHQTGANEYKILEQITTKPRARTIAIDEATHKLYLPTAEFNPLPANAAKTDRPIMKAGTFQVLVVEQQ